MSKISYQTRPSGPGRLLGGSGRLAMGASQGSPTPRWSCCFLMLLLVLLSLVFFSAAGFVTAPTVAGIRMSLHFETQL